VLPEEAEQIIEATPKKKAIRKKQHTESKGDIVIDMVEIKKDIAQEAKKPLDEDKPQEEVQQVEEIPQEGLPQEELPQEDIPQKKKKGAKPKEDKPDYGEKVKCERCNKTISLHNFRYILCKTCKPPDESLDKSIVIVNSNPEIVEEIKNNIRPPIPRPVEDITIPAARQMVMNYQERKRNMYIEKTNKYRELVKKSLNK